MQTFTSAHCSTLEQGQSLTLTDSRDNNNYTIKKLPDNKCWMTQNLRLVGSRTLTSSDSNVSSNFTLPAAGNWSSSSTTARVVWNNGAFYNWYAITAGTGTSNMANNNASSSICPKGWRLPTGGSSGEFAVLDKAYGGTGANRSDANTYNNFVDTNYASFTLPGIYENSATISAVDTRGLYWSSTAQSSSCCAHYLSLDKNSSYVGLQSSGYKTYALSARCVSN